MDWEVGDVALCIKRGAWRGSLTGRSVDGPKFGERLVVSEVCEARVLCLRFTRWHGCDRGLLWNASRFIKLNGLEADTFDREVIEALKSKPVHAPQHDALHNSCQCEVSGCLSLTQVSP